LTHDGSITVTLGDCNIVKSGENDSLKTRDNNSVTRDECYKLTTGNSISVTFPYINAPNILESISVTPGDSNRLTPAGCGTVTDCCSSILTPLEIVSLTVGDNDKITPGESIAITPGTVTPSDTIFVQHSESYILIFCNSI
jgi:hypothetical protein